MALFKKDQEENEVSGGQVFGYILLGAAALFVIAFVIFICITKVQGKKADTAQDPVAVETTVETEDTVNE